MKVDRVICYGSVEVMQSNGLKGWIKAGFEATIEEGENHIECYRKLKDDVRTALGSNSVPFNETKLPEPEPIPEIDYGEKDKVEAAIDETKSLNELAKLKMQAEKFYLQSAYITKMKQFI